MTTREEWLSAAAEAIKDDRHLYYVNSYYQTPTILPSFPGRSTRSVMLGDIARQEENNQPVLLVSPLIASSLEVSIVLYWLMVRHNYGMADPARMGNRYNVSVLEGAGFNAPWKSCVPTEALIDRVAAAIEPVVNRMGEYPSQEVRLVRGPTQSTRLLKVACTLHRDPYILRMSQKQYDRGAPSCGVCNAAMILV